jgi:hypothetical protein
VDSRETVRAAAGIPAALAEPAGPVRARWITLLFVANVGLWLAIYLADAAHYHDPQIGLLTLMALYAVAPIIAGAVLGLMLSYPSLFALAGLASIAADVTITKVRSVP